MSKVFADKVLAGKVAFVTGGTSGINLGIALRFAEHGAKVAVLGRNEEKAKAAEALGCTGIRVERPEQMGPALQRAKELKGPVVIDVVVTRDPSKMLPGVDNRTAQVKQGDRVA